MMKRCTWFRKHKLGKIQSDGYQYCERCGQAFIPSCNHKWVLIVENAIKFDWSYRLAYGNKQDYTERVYECSKCKEIRKEII